MRNLLSSLALLGALVTTGASAELLINGDFEQVPVAAEDIAEKGWGNFDNNTMIGWSAKNGVTEVWAGYGGYLPYDGLQLSELNSVSLNTLYQLFPTVAGNSYVFSIYYDSRYDFIDGGTRPEERFNVSVQDFDTSELIYSVDVLDNASSGSWEQLTFSFVAQGDVTRLAIEALTVVGKSSGVLLDAASVQAQGPDVEFNDGSFLKDVPVPFLGAGFALGLIGLRNARRNRRNV